VNGLSLFSGIGGLDLGLERAGITTVGQVEIDPWCRRVLAKHWPDVPRHDDVRTAADWWLSEERPVVDLVFGGFPCQDISNAGRRAGINGERSGLWSEFHHIIRVLRPHWVLLENVAAILGRGAGRVLGDLAEIGYDAEWDCIPAAAVGAPHLRDRWFAVAYPESGVEPGKPQGAHDAAPVGAFARTSGGASSGDLAPGVRVGRRTAPGGPATLANAEGQRGELRSASRERQRRPSSRRDLGNPSRGRGRAGLREAGAGEGTARILVAEPRNAGWWATEPNVGRVAHGVPGRVDRLRGLGNAVVPQVAEHVGRLIVAADRERAA
jgi:DNA (cytosine-5)-methyltransferase 1